MYRLLSLAVTRRVCRVGGTNSQPRLSQRCFESTASNTAKTATTPTAAAATAATTSTTTAARTSYRWLITGLAVPLTLGLLLDRSLAPTPSSPLGTGLFNSSSTSPAQPQHRLLEEPQEQTQHSKSAPPGLHETTGPIIEQPLAGGVGAQILNEQAKMWTCLWGMTDEAPCSFPII